MSGVWWDQCVDGYLRALARRNRRPETLRTYRAELRMFGSWLELNGVTEAAAITRDHVEAWQDELRTQRSPNTQLVAAAALRGVLRWGVDRDLGIGSSLWLRVTSPAVPQGLPRPVPAKHLEILQQAFESPVAGDARQQCLRALFWVILSSGARISEALSLPRHALDEGSATVTQKGGRAHLMVISEKARRAVREWEESRSDSCWAMFPSPKLGVKPARRAEIQKEWDRICRELGIPRFKSHQLRHSCATTLRRSGADIVLVAQHLGHRGLEYVRNYALVETEERFTAMRAFDGQLAS